MRRLSVWSVLVLLVGCAVQNNPMPTWNGEDEGGASGSSGNAGNGGSGGSSSQAGSANKAGGGAGGKAGAGTGGDAEPQGGSGGGGKGGTAGAGGTGGKGGTGGTGGGGTGGTAGSGGSSGSGGSGGSGVDCKDAAPVTVAGLSARYVSEPGPDTAIGAQLELHYTGANPLNLADLKLRYYFTNEVTAPLQVTINWAWYRAGEVDKKDKVVFAVVKLGCQANNADTYLEFKFKDDAGLLESNHSLILSFSASNGMGQAFTQTNDYSYDAAAKIDADYAKVAVFQNSGNRVWGAEP